MSQSLLVSVAAATQSAVEILIARDVPQADAQIIAEKMVAADVRGVDTHGLFCLREYVDCLADRRINPTPNMIVTRRMPWAARIDGDNGMGHLAADKAMRLALESAEAMGIGVTTVFNSNHYGAAGAYTAMAAAQGCIGMGTANAIAVTAPHGAKAPFMGTNPFAFAAPAGKYAPFSLDMATSAGARRSIRKALAEGETIPEGWATDKDGVPTTDPAEAMTGMLLPFGGAKGSGLALAMDILSGVMSGGMFADDVLNNFTNQERGAGNCHFFMAFKVSAFLDEDDFAARMEDDISRLHNLTPMVPGQTVRYPGERGAEVAAARMQQGIPYPKRIVDDLIAMGGGQALA